MRVLIHTFEPGLFGDDQAASKFGGATWIMEVVNYLTTKGHEVKFAFPHHSYFDGTLILEESRIRAMTPTKIPIVTSKSDIMEFDVALFYYRWNMPDRPERQYAFACQQLMFEWFDDEKKPYIVFDGDHMITDQVARRVTSRSGFIAAPELRPMRPYVRTLMYPYIHKPLVDQPERDKSVVYVGNDYGRREQTIEFMNPLSKKYEIRVFGNWGTTEEQISKNKSEMPDVKFMGPISPDLVISELSRASWTVHLMKPSYVDSGFCTFRWVEAAMAKTPAFIPRKFPFPYEYLFPSSKGHRDFFGYVKNGEDARDLSIESRQAILTNQTAFVKSYFKVDRWEEALYEAIKNKWYGLKKR